MNNNTILIIFGLLLVLCLFFTDIPVTFIKLIAQLFNPKSIKSEDENIWSKTPVSPSKIPLWGYFKTKRLKSKICRYNIEMLQNHLRGVSWLHEQLRHSSKDFSLENELKDFPSRRDVGLTIEKFTVVKGLPGSGKTTYVLNYLLQCVKQKNEMLVIYFPFTYLQKKNILSTSIDPEEMGQIIWRSVFNLLVRHGINKFFKPDPIVISYIFNQWETVIYIDDVNGTENIKLINESFLAYQQLYHNRKNKLSVLITTRDESGSLSSTEVNPFIFNLPPLSKEDTQFFFDQKCNDLAIEKNMDFYDLVTPIDSLLRFEDKFTQNPLFVEVVAYMIQKGSNEDLKVVFQKSIPEVYRHFIKILFGRKEEQTAYDSFYYRFRALAYKVWMNNSDDFDDLMIRDTIKDDRYSSEFLYSRGLLKRDILQGTTRYRFINKTICDILFVEQCVATGDYSLFSANNNIGKIYEYYLSEQIQTAKQLSELVLANPVVGLKLSSQQNFLEKVLKAEDDRKFAFDMCFYYYVIGVKIYDNTEVITQYLRRICNLMKNDAEDFVLERFTKEATLSQKALRYAAMFRYPSLDKFIVSNLAKGKWTAEIRSLLSDGVPDVNRMINLFLSTSYINTDIQNSLLVFLLASPLTKSDREKHSSWLYENARKLSDYSLGVLLSNVEFREGFFCQEYTFESLHELKRINKILIRFDSSDVFIPKGEYLCGGKKIYNRTGLRVPKTPNEILVIATNNYDAEISTLNNISSSLLNFDQLQIMYTHFGKSWAGDIEGVNTLSTDSIKNKKILYEAYKDNNYGRLYFASLSNNVSNSMALQISGSQSGQSKFVENIIYRIPKRYL